jgi:4-hydroxymandelate oxidase
VIERTTIPPVNLHEYAEAARERLSPMTYGFISGGAEDEVTLRANRSGFERWRLLPRALTGVDSPVLATTVQGHEISMPVMIAPMGLHCLAHPDGELASAAAAQTAGTIFSLGVAASRAIEEVAPVAGIWWFQIYLLADRALTLEIVKRAENAGASAIVLTVDVAVRGRREADERNRFEIPPEVTMPHLRVRVAGDDEHPSYFTLTVWDKAISWRDVDWLVSQTSLPVIVKGILSPEDATLAVEHGAKGVIVSNHGGRQLDSAVASIDALPAVAGVIADRAEVYLDGGVRRGTDVLKAVALGARAVFVGRPVLYGLALDGEAGVRRMLDLLRQELIIDMILCGAGEIAKLSRGLVVPDGPRHPGYTV